LLTGDARVTIYDRHVFIVQATVASVIKLFSSSLVKRTCYLKGSSLTCLSSLVYKSDPTRGEHILGATL
jgi:hypothetical protein